MGAAVLPFVPRRSASRWQVDEIAECYRVIDILHGVGMSVSLEVGASDEGDPWLVFIREDTQDVIFHIARMGGPLVASSAASDTLFHGRNMRDLLQRILQTQPFVLPSSKPLGWDDRLLMHPATMLVAVLATAFLASQDSAALAGTDETAPRAEPAQAGETANVIRKHLEPNGPPGRSVPAAEQPTISASTIASAVLAAVTVIAGEQILRSGELHPDERFIFSTMTALAAHHAPPQPASPVIGIEQDPEPQNQQAPAQSFDFDDSRNLGLAYQQTGTDLGALRAGVPPPGTPLDGNDVAGSFNLAITAALKGGFGLESISIGGGQLAFGSYLSGMFPDAVFAMKAPAGAEDGQAGLDEGGHLPASSASPSTTSAAPASGLAQAGGGGVSHAAMSMPDLATAMVDAKLIVSKMSLSVADLFWYGASIMRGAGLDPYNATRANSMVADIADTKPLSDKSMLGSPSDGHVVADASPVAKANLDGVFADSVGNGLANTVAPIDLAPLIDAPLGGRVIAPSSPLHNAPAGTAPNSTRPEPGDDLSPTQIVQIAQSIVNFIYDPRHEITLKGQDLEILQILVKNNPAIAGSDRLLLTHGQILAGDGVMLMPGVALVPSEIFTPKIVADLPTKAGSTLDVFFSHDLTVTLAGVIDL